MGYTHYWDINENSTFTLEKLIEIKKHLDNILFKYKKIIQYEEGIPTLYETVYDWKNDFIEVRFNGVGENAHETFILSKSSTWTLCKTARKEYDIVVCEVLLLYYHYGLLSKLISNGFINSAKNYKVGQRVKKKDIDGNWYKAVKNINKRLQTNYIFVVDDIHENKYISYKLILK